MNDEIEALIYGHEIDLQSNMEITRDMTGIMVSPYVKNGWDIRRFYRFGWEQELIVDKMTLTELTDFNKIAEIVRAKRKKKNG